MPPAPGTTVPPPQCPECGRFLATAFVESIKSEPAPCPRCGTELSLVEEEGEGATDGTAGAGGAAAPEEPPPSPPPPPAASTALDDVEPEPETSVRPPDLAQERDPLEGWDASRTVPARPDEPDPAVLAAGAGIGLLLGMLLGGKDHRGLGALLGAALGAVLARLRG